MSQRNFYLKTIIISVVFGVASGLVGALFFRSFLIEDLLNIQLGSEMNFSDYGLRQPSLVISEVKKVVVVEDDRINEVSGKVKNNIVGFFKNPSQLKDNTIDKYFHQDDAVGQGFIITSDGWIITNSFNRLLTQFSEAGLKKHITENYSMITAWGEIFSIMNVVIDGYTGFTFLQVDNDDFPVLSFADMGEISVGQSVLGINFSGRILTSKISGILSGDKEKNAGKPNFTIELMGEINNVLVNSFLFDMSSNVVAFIDESGVALPFIQFEPAVKSLLRLNDIQRPSFDLTYISLDDIYMPLDADIKTGALVVSYKNSVAPTTVLKNGDIIKSVNNQIVNSSADLTTIIQKQISGETVNLLFSRNGVDLSADIKL